MHFNVASEGTTLKRTVVLNATPYKGDRIPIRDGGWDINKCVPTQKTPGRNSLTTYGIGGVGTKNQKNFAKCFVVS